MTGEEAAALAERLAGIAAFIDAIGAWLGPQSDIRFACAAVAAQHLDAAAVAEFTRLLGGGSTSWGAPAFTPACLSCGATDDLDAVHRRAEYGIAARVVYYCHNPGPCAERRHGHAAAISGIAS